MLGPRAMTDGRIPMRVAPACESQAPAIAAMSERVQAALEAAGSAQEFGPIPREVVEAKVRAGNAFVLVDDRVLGSVFVEPMLPQWGIEGPAWYLSKLMIEPDARGRGLGRVLLDGVRGLIPPGGLLVLDCWAGNAKLREFYVRAGFRLHDVFPEGDYEIAVFVATSSESKVASAE